VSKVPEIGGISLPFLPAGGVSTLNSYSGSIKNPNKIENSKFNELFQKELNQLKFSSHARTRMETRDIALSEKDMARLENAVDTARSKGSKESLVILDDKAFIVSITNYTVITASEKNKLESNIITNIDSAVFA
jgi:flagellar operon protein